MYVYVCIVVATRSQVPGQPRVCFRCKSPGHYIKDCPQSRQVGTSTNQVSITHEQPTCGAHEQPSADTQQPPSLTEEYSEVPQWHDVPLSLPVDTEDEGWTPCAEEHKDDDDHDRNATDHTQQTSMSVTEDQPKTAEQVETCTVTADTETSTNPTQHSNDPHETVASVTQCLEQAQTTTIDPPASSMPFSQLSTHDQMYTSVEPSSASVQTAPQFVLPTLSLADALVHRKSKQVGPKRCGTEQPQRKSKRKTPRRKVKCREQDMNDTEANMQSDASDVSQT